MTLHDHQSTKLLVSYKALLLPLQSQTGCTIFSQHAAELRLWWHIMNLAIHRTKAKDSKLQEE